MDKMAENIASHSIFSSACSIANPETIRQLQLSEIFFNYSVNCLVILDRDYNFVRVNEAYARACRRGIDEFAGHNHFELYPSDARLMFDEVIRTKQPIVTIMRPFEYADQPERGVTYWDWTLIPVLDRQGEVEYLVLSLVEVTERKRAEEALRIAALVYQHSAEAMLVTDAANCIIATNDAFTLLTGYAADELLGNNLDMLKSDRQCAEFYEAMLQALNTAGHWKGELWSRRKNGDPMILRLSINTAHDVAGKKERRVALFSDITEAKQAQSLIWEQANLDALTKLPNRYMFHDRLAHHIEQARHTGKTLALFLIDLDQFKEINDTLGHDKGDMLLIEVARRIKGCLLESTVLARLGGDEFAVILSEPDELDHLNTTANQIIEKLAAPFCLDVETVYVSASIGIALFPEDSTEMDDLLRHADQAMYAAKNAGRNRYCYFTSAMQEAAQSRMQLTNDLRGALSGNQFEVHYQPIVELATGRIRKAEALIRWHHPVRGMVDPVDFISLAESSGLILDIGTWVFKKAAEQVQRLRSLNDPEFQISVNVSPAQFHNDSKLHTTWLKHLAALDLPAHSVAIEITEGLLLDLTAEVKDKLLAFRDAGTQVALDDFGTGYSSLAYLKKFDIDYIKIDRAFVSNLEESSDDHALCEAIIVMAHKLGLKVIAEGVETAAQRDLLAAAGCDFAQGYFFSKAVSSEQFETLLRQRR